MRIEDYAETELKELLKRIRNYLKEEHKKDGITIWKEVNEHYYNILKSVILPIIEFEIETYK